MVSTFRWRDGTRFCVPGLFLILLASTTITIPSYSQSEQGYASESLFIALFSDGDALVEYDISIEDPLAEEIRIKLFANGSVSNLIVVDYDDRIIDYDLGGSPSEIVLKTPGVSNARISYSTQDFVNKNQGRWIFSLDSSSIGFTVRLPPESVLIDPGQNFPTIRQLGNQQLLTFKPGDVRFVYVIGVLGTEEQATIVIRLAETTIKEIGDTHPGIVLAEAEEILQRAIDARDDGRFPDAESLAGQANDVALAIERDYEAAQSAIADADGEIERARNEGRDTAAAALLFQQASSEFAAGSYVAAKDSAEDAVSAIAARPPEPQMPLFVIVTAVVAAAGGVGALVFLRMRKPRPLAQQKRIGEETRRISPADLGVKQPNPKSSVPELSTEPRGPEMRPETAPAELGYDPPLAAPSTIPESQIDKSVLLRIVSRIVEEKPQLRPEDQDVLRYLAEKEGAAFESEIRTRFQLPKTTIWRLVKRLEREELVEIRKAGGQNLIKLRFEDRQP
ncbi:MAG: hypothetical protein MN733_04105 [Nitrososphaera sp.]|nr:hypothetical protein [Nitrososphaera sp.]